MRFFSRIAVVLLGLVTAMPAQACLSPISQSTIFPITAEKPEEGSIPEGAHLYRVRYSGERLGRSDRLWPNYYVVDILEGPTSNTKAAIPAHITSCISVRLEAGEEGWIVATTVVDGQYGGEQPYLTLDVLNSGRTENWTTLLEKRLQN